MTSSPDVCVHAQPVHGALQALQCLVSTLRSLVEWYTRCQAASAAAEAAEAGPAGSAGAADWGPQQDWGTLTSRSTTDVSPTPDAPGTPLLTTLQEDVVLRVAALTQQDT